MERSSAKGKKANPSHSRIRQGIVWTASTEMKEKVRYIPLHEISANLGQELTATLFAFHAITGCDSTSCFKGRGKKRSLLVLKSSTEEFQSQISFGD